MNSLYACSGGLSRRDKRCELTEGGTEMKRWTTSGGITIERLNTLKCNCYVIQCAGAVYLVDTSVVMERQSIERQLKKLGISGLDGIILTHVHTDHVGNAACFQKKFNCLVYVHAHERTAPVSYTHLDVYKRQSQAIADIEKYYNVRLFERLSRKLYITPAGERLLDYARHIVALFDEMELEMKYSTEHTTLKIGGTVTVGTTILSELVSRFEAENPPVTLPVLCLLYTS